MPKKTRIVKINNDECRKKYNKNFYFVRSTFVMRTRLAVHDLDFVAKSILTIAQRSPALSPVPAPRLRPAQAQLESNHVEQVPLIAAGNVKPTSTQSLLTFVDLNMDASCPPPPTIVRYELRKPVPAINEIPQKCQQHFECFIFR